MYKRWSLVLACDTFMLELWVEMSAWQIAISNS